MLQECVAHVPMTVELEKQRQQDCQVCTWEAEAGGPCECESHLVYILSSSQSSTVRPWLKQHKPKPDPTS